MEDDLIKEWAKQRSEKKEKPQDASSAVLQQLSLEWLAKLQRTFMTATGLNGNVVDENGVSVTRIQDEVAPRFCRLVHESREGMRRCIQSDRKTTRRSFRSSAVAVCKCHAGLYDSAVPIRFKDHGLGAFITGQVLLTNPDEQTVAEILERVNDLHLDRDLLQEAIYDIPVITEEKLKATTELMKLLVDYIVKTLEEAQAQRREAEMRTLYLETEMRVIQSRLHPHFLFNILNLVSGQALLEGAMATYGTLNHLSKLLRQIVKSHRPLIALSEEMEHLSSYLALQRLRFEDRLQIDIAWDPTAVGEALIPALTLQILIENAIKHGIEPKEGPCLLQVKIEKRQGKLEVVVNDDGVGMSEETWRSIASGQTEGEISGLSMIRKRLDYYFSGDFSLRLMPQHLGGTEVCLSIPYTTK